MGEILAYGSYNSHCLLRIGNISNIIHNYNRNFAYFKVNIRKTRGQVNMKFIKRYWLEISVVGIIFAVLLNDNLPSLTWMNTDSDGAHYLLAAKYLYPSHNTSAPLFLLLGHMFLWIPFGSESWRLGLIMVLSTTVACILIYLIVRRLLLENKKARWYALIAMLTYGGSALVISQSTIVDTYALDTMLMLLAYYLCLKRNWVWASVAIGLLWAIHTLFAWMIWFVLFIMYKEMRNIVLVVITLSFLLFYLYIPITVAINHPPNMWNNETFGGFFQSSFSVFAILTGGLSVWDFPKRILDTIGILGVSLGFGIIAIIWYFIKTRKRSHNGLLWLLLIPIAWFVTNLAAETYVYLIMAVAFGAIVMALGLSKMRIGWALVTAIVAVGFLVFNANYFDIGRTEDSEMSAIKFYKEELPKIPDGQYFMGGAWNWAMVYLYNKEEGRNIIPISTDSLPAENYLDVLEKQGIKFERNNLLYLDKQITLELSVTKLNEGVWIAKETKPEVYQYTIEKARGNETYIGKWLNQPMIVTWKWKPSNPYKYISGALEVAEWNRILFSNWNVRFFVDIAFLGLILNWLMWKLPFFGKLDKKKVGKMSSVK
jgi:hypothetical protein